MKTIVFIGFFLSSFEANANELSCNLEGLSRKIEELEERVSTLIDGEQRVRVRRSAEMRRKGSLELLLPSNYDRRQFPPKERPDIPNEISVIMDIYSIPQLDEKKEEIMLEVRLTHFWREDRINHTFYRPVELMPEAITAFWTPDSYFHHAKDSKVVKLITEPASLRITPDKVIKYSMTTMVTIGCPMSFHYFPMDHQSCRLELQSFGYDVHHNNYTWKRRPIMKEDIDLDNFFAHISEYSFSYSSDGIHYPGLGIRLGLKRHLGYHLIQTYIPSIILVTVAWISFMVPSDVVPGRMAVCVTTFLTLVSMFGAVRGLTPQVSYMKAIDLWVFSCLLFVFFTLAEFGVVLHLTSRSKWQQKVDNHLRVVTGKQRIMKLTPVEMVALNLKGKKQNFHSDIAFHPDLVENNKSNNNINRVVTNATFINNKEPSYKERLAYTIEWAVKFLYPFFFLIFNFCYWGFYLEFFMTLHEETA